MKKIILLLLFPLTLSGQVRLTVDKLTIKNSLKFKDSTITYFYGDSIPNFKWVRENSGGIGSINSGILQWIPDSLSFWPYPNQAAAKKGSFYYAESAAIGIDTSIFINTIGDGFNPALIAGSEYSTGIQAFTTSGHANALFGSSGDSVVFPRIGNLMTGYRGGTERFYITDKGFIGQKHNGQNNTSIGDSALNRVKTGTYNFAAGNYALNKNIYGNYNVANGAYSQYNNIGSNNTSLGHRSLYTNTVGYENTALGFDNMYSNLTGVRNTSIGAMSLYSNTQAHHNTSIGYQSLYYNWGGGNNTSIGCQSLFSTTMGADNTSIGAYSAYKNISGRTNMSTGIYAMYNNLTGNYNTAIGSYSLYSNTTNSYNIGIGNYSGRYTDLPNRLFINSLNRTNTGGDTTKSIIYGLQATNTDDQRLYLNAGEVYFKGGRNTYKSKIDSAGVFYGQTAHCSLYRNTDLTISADQNVWYKIIGFTTKDADYFTVQGDSVQFQKAGHYLINLTVSFSGINNEIWELGVFKGGALEEPSQLRYTSTADVGNMSCPVYISVTENQWVSFKIRNTTDGDDPTIKRFSVIINAIHLNI